MPWLALFDLQTIPFPPENQEKEITTFFLIAYPTLKNYEIGKDQ
jgi:hypothetical protein